MRLLKGSLLASTVLEEVPETVRALVFCFISSWRMCVKVCGSLSGAEKRQAEAARIRDKYPDRIPVRDEEALPSLHCRCFSSCKVA